MWMRPLASEGKFLSVVCDSADQGVAMRCTQCGADNPDHVLYCGSCSEVLRVPVPTAADADETTEPPSSQPPDYAPLAEGGGRHGQTSTFAMATYAAVIGLALIVTGFLLYAYYYERILSQTWDYDDMRNLSNLIKISNYASTFGWIIVTSGVALAIKGLLDRGFESASAVLRKVDLKSVLRLVILLLVVMMVSAVAMVVMYESGSDIGYDVSRILSRMYMYLMSVSSVVEGVVVLVVVNSLRKAEALEKT